MKILYLAHRVPYPPNKGDKIRSFNEIVYLSRKHEVHLCCLADDATDTGYVNELKQYCASVYITAFSPRVARVRSGLSLLTGTSLSVPYFYSRRLQGIIDRLCTAVSFDCILCYSSPMAEYVFRSRCLQAKGCEERSIVLVMDFVDVDSDKWVQYSHSTRWPISLLYRLEGRRLAGYERRIADSFDQSIFVSPHEAATFLAGWQPVRTVSVVPNGVDLVYFRPDADLADESSGEGLHKDSGSGPMLLFTGAMDYYPNINGVEWFCREIFPAVQERCPGALFYIVGGKPTAGVTALARVPGVVVTGFVHDMRPYYKAADVSVIPLRLARGVQNKVLEAMAMGKAIVATSRAVQGIETDPDRQLMVCDDPKQFAENILGILQDSVLRQNAGSYNRQWVEKNYQWSDHMEKLETLLHKGAALSYPQSAKQ